MIIIRCFWKRKLLFQYGGSEFKAAKFVIHCNFHGDCFGNIKNINRFHTTHDIHPKETLAFTFGGSLNYDKWEILFC
jgi:hypothetical protein